MYAIIETGGKQHKITEGQVVDVEHLNVADGGSVEIDRVLLVGSDDGVIVGKPTVEGAKVQATVQQDVKGKKVIVFKYKPKVRYRRKTGHRHLYSRLLIDKIVSPEITGEAKAVKKPRRTKKEVTEDGA